MVKINWRDYHNSQKYCECQVVSVLNAYYYLTGRKVSQECFLYEYLVDVAVARHGAAFESGMKRIYKILNLSVKKSKEFPRKLPIKVSVWHDKYGYHSVLIVDRKKDQYRVTNFSKVTNSGWISKKEFKSCIPSFPCNRYPYSIFSIKKNLV